MRVPVARVARGVRLAALAGALLVSALVGPGIAAAVTDPCADPTQCATITVNVGGNGSFVISTGDGYIRCVRSGGITTGTCVHRYVTGSSPIDVPMGVDFSDDTLSCDITGEYCNPTPGLVATFPLTINPGEDQVLNWHGFLTNPSTLTVKRYGTGKGYVSSEPRGIDCGTKCTADYQVGSTVILVAKPLLGVVFTSWTGPCKGQGAKCTFVVPSGGVNIRATFTYVPPASPSPSIAPTAAPTDTPEPTAAPTDTPEPTAAPTEPPTAAPSAAPSASAAPSPSGDASGSGGGALLIVAVAGVVVIGGGLFVASRRKPAA